MADTPTLQIRVVLEEIEPKVWRRLWLAADTPLARLHIILQGAMDWDNCHLHGFRQGSRRFSDEAEAGSGMEDERKITIGELLSTKGSELTYDYDFGDDWQHTLKLERSFPGLPAPHVELPMLIDGANACPPEDCGGPLYYPVFVQQVQEKDSDTLEWLQETGLGSDLTPEYFDIELAHEGMMELIEGYGEDGVPDSRFDTIENFADLPDSWSPLEEQLALTKLHQYLQDPRWSSMFAFAAETLSIGVGIFGPDGQSPEDIVPGYANLQRDHVAYDLSLGEEEFVMPNFLQEHPDLPPGAQRFLCNMMDSLLAPYQIAKQSKDGALQLTDLIDGKRIRAQFSATPFTPELPVETGHLLVARVIPRGKDHVIVGQSLTCPYDSGEFRDLMDMVAQACKELDGDPSDRSQLLQPALPHLITFWLMQMRPDSGCKFPLVLLPGEEWNPGEGRYVVATHSPTAASVLQDCADLEAVTEGVWALPLPDSNRGPLEGGPAMPMGWVQLFDNQLLLWAGGKSSMKALRTVIKKAKIPDLHHISTRYGLEGSLSVYEFATESLG